MIINGINFPNIGNIRAKTLPNTEDWQLTIYPPTRGPLMGHEPAVAVEVRASAKEVQRIDCVAPHLISSGDFRRRQILHGPSPIRRPKATGRDAVDA